MFYNPYGFVPADRRAVPVEKGPVDGLADGPPAPLGRLRPGRWTGRLRLTLTTETPLLLTEVDGLDGEHPTRRTRRDPRHPGDRAELLATAVKGMLRSAYEAATNSRFGVFADHGRLTRRAGTNEAANLVPARVVSNNSDGVHVELLLGFANPGQHGKGGIQCGVRVPRYHSKPGSNPECNVDPNGVRHGDEVVALIGTFKRRTKGGTERTDRRVVEIVPYGQRPDQQSAERRARALAAQLKSRYAGYRPRRGWYSETRQGIATKLDERFFFHDPERRDEPPRLPVSSEVVAAWRELMESYRDRKDQTLKRVGKDAPDCSLFIVDDEEFNRWRKLATGTLCYAEVKGNEVAGYRVTALYPVSISRRLFPRSPRDLAKRQRATPTDGEQAASVADRVFGWAASLSARRGRVRISTPTQRAGTTVAELNGQDGVPLAILSTPKSSYELFYAGKADGSPGGLGEGFGPSGGLRGRKIWPAHPREPDRWRLDQDQPWRRAKQVRDDQNASIVDWVAPGAEFDVDLLVEELSEVELGALLWLVRPASASSGNVIERRHRLGLGRPLGFGTVRLRVDWRRSWLRDGDGWRSYYRLEAVPANDGAQSAEQGERWVETFERAVETMYGQRRPRFLAALERALAGFPADGPDRLPVHYPPNPADPASGTDNYKWFVANTSRDGQQQRLGDLANSWSELRLPVDPKRTRGGGGRGRRGRSG